jgi:hypothetical protein
VCLYSGASPIFCDCPAFFLTCLFCTLKQEAISPLLHFSSLRWMMYEPAPGLAHSMFSFLAYSIHNILARGLQGHCQADRVLLLWAPGDRMAGPPGVCAQEASPLLVGGGQRRSAVTTPARVCSECCLYHFSIYAQTLDRAFSAICAPTAALSFCLPGIVVPLCLLHVSDLLHRSLAMNRPYSSHQLCLQGPAASAIQGTRPDNGLTG